MVAIYRFARAADDFADEGDAPRRSAWPRSAEFDAALDAHRAAANAGGAAVSCAGQRDPRARLADGAVPRSGLRVRAGRDGGPLCDLADVLDYCRRSANPVGRLLLALYGARRRT